MAWPFTTEKNWGKGGEPTLYDDQPLDADTLIYAGCPAGINAGSAPVGCVRPLSVVTPDVFAGFAEVTADNTVAGAASPNILNRPNFGDGTTGVNGAKARLRVAGLIRFEAAAVPDGTGALGTITGMAGTQADLGVAVYYNGTGFTTSNAGNNTKVGTVAAVGLTPFGGIYWDVRFRAASVRNS